VLSRRNLLSGLGATAAASLTPLSAHASYASAASVAELLERSRVAVLATAYDAYSQWESVEGTRRIVTYTRLITEAVIDGRDAELPEVLVRTLGGRVGDIGQVVHGEARLELEKAQVVFLSRAGQDVHRVTEMAQGHYLVRPDAQRVSRLTRSPNLPHLREPGTSAVRLLPGKTVEEVRRLLVQQLNDAR
jgi:hypothetical protein